MPDLGKATYTVVLDSRQFDANLARTEAKATAATNKMAASFSKADAAVASLGPTAAATAGEVAAATGQMQFEFAEVGAASEAASTKSASAWRRAATSIKASAASMVGSARGVGAAWAAAGDKMMAAGKKMTRTGRAMTRQITLPMAIVGGVATKMALDYQEQISLLGAQAGASEQEMAFLTDRIKEFAGSGQSVHTANQLAKAMFNIESGGFRGAKALDLLTGASHLSMVGNSELEASTRALVGVMKTEIKGAEDSTKAIGALNAIVGAGMMRMEDLVSALGTGILPVAKSIGLGLDEVGAALAVFTARGQGAQQSATRIKQALAMMAAPSEKAAKALAKLGLGRLDLLRVLQSPAGLVGAIDLLRDRLLKVDDRAKRTQIVLDAFGGGRTGPAMQLLIQASEDLHVKLDQVRRDGGKVKKTIQDELGEPINQLRIAWGKMSEKLIDLGNRLIPHVLKIADAVLKVADAFESLPGPVKTATVAAIGIAAVLGPIVTMVGLMTIGLGGIGAGFAKVGLAMTTTIPLIAAAAAAFGTLTWAIHQADEAMTAWETGLERTMSQQSQITDVFNIRYRMFRERGMSDKEARAAATKDAEAFAKRAGFDTSAGLFRPAGTGTKAPKAPKTPDLFDPTSLITGPDKDKGKTKKKDRPELVLVPNRIRLRITKAARTKWLRDDLDAQKDEMRYLRQLLKNKKLNKSERIDVQEAITSAMEETRRINEEIKQRQEEASEVDDPILLPDKVRFRLAKAALTKSLRDDLAENKRHESYLRKLLKNKKLSLAQRASILEELKNVLDEIKRINEEMKETADETNEAQRAAFDALQERASFFGSFGSSVFQETPALPGAPQPSRTPGSGPIEMARGGIVPGRGNNDSVPALLTPGEGVLTKREMGGLASLLSDRAPAGSRRGRAGTTIQKFENHQHFPYPTTDRHREARYAKVAAESVFDGVGGGDY